MDFKIYHAASCNLVSTMEISRLVNDVQGNERDKEVQLKFDVDIDDEGTFDLVEKTLNFLTLS